MSACPVETPNVVGVGVHVAAGGRLTRDFFSFSRLSFGLVFRLGNEWPGWSASW